MAPVASVGGERITRSIATRLSAKDVAAGVSKLILVTWDEFTHYKGASRELEQTHPSDDDSDDDDIDSDDDFGLPEVVKTATDVPTFEVTTDSSLPRSPSVPSTTLEECINVPTFALVSDEIFAAEPVAAAVMTPASTEARSKRKRKAKEPKKANDDLDSKVFTLLPDVKRVFSRKKRNPLQPKIPNAPVAYDVHRVSV